MKGLDQCKRVLKALYSVQGGFPCKAAFQGPLHKSWCRGYARRLRSGQERCVECRATALWSFWAMLQTVECPWEAAVTTWPPGVSKVCSGYKGCLKSPSFTFSVSCKFLLEHRIFLVWNCLLWFHFPSCFDKLPPLRYLSRAHCKAY